jgi:hypothetical protein
MQDNLKHLALGILVGYLTPYLLTLIKKPQPAAQEAESEEY